MPVRASVRKRATKAVAEEIQDHEDQEVVASFNKHRHSRSSSSSTSSKKSKPPPKKAKAMAKKVERKETPVEDELCTKEPDEEEIALSEEDEAEEQERQVEEVAAVSPEKARRAGSGGDEHEPEFVGDSVPPAEARAKWPKRYNCGTAARRYISSNLLFF
jgi:hypothetical protein